LDVLDTAEAFYSPSGSGSDVSPLAALEVQPVAYLQCPQQIEDFAYRQSKSKAVQLKQPLLPAESDSGCVAISVCIKQIELMLAHRYTVYLFLHYLHSSVLPLERQQGDEESAHPPPRFGIFTQEMLLPTETAKLIVRTSMVVSVRDLEGTDLTVEVHRDDVMRGGGSGAGNGGGSSNRDTNRDRLVSLVP